MTDISLLNYFGTSNDFDDLKKWFRINSELYKEVINAAKERCDLESEYSSRLSKINAKLYKSFSQSLGSVSMLWSKTATLMNEESEVHKTLGCQLSEDFYKPLINISEQYNKLKKPIEVNIDKCIKLHQDRRDEEYRLKKKAFLSTKDSEKAYENIAEYKATHPSSVSGNDKEKSKIEKRAVQLLDCSIKAEAEYFESSLSSEDSRHKWEQSYISGLEQLQKFETDRLNSMKSVIESYHKCISSIPPAYSDIATKLLRELHSVNIRDDLFENSMHYTNKSPNIYKTEQLLLDFFAEPRENKMDLNRRKDNLMRHIGVLYDHEKKFDNLRTGTLKMITVYEDSPEFADDSTRNKTKREYSKTQCVVNLLSANLYKLQVTLNGYDNKALPTNPLISAAMKILVVTDRNTLMQSVLESKPGSILPFFEPGIMSRTNLNHGSSMNEQCVYDEDGGKDDSDFDTDSDTEPPIPARTLVSQISHSSSTLSSQSRTSVQDLVNNFKPVPLPKVQTLGNNFKPVPLPKAQTLINNYKPVPLPKAQTLGNNYKPAPRPLPELPTETQCQALHDFVARDVEELSFNEGDIIIVKNKLSDVWWEGQLRGKFGLVPTSYVKELL